MKYLNAINKIPGIGPKRIRRLMRFFGSFEAAWNAEIEDLLESKIGEKVSWKFLKERKTIDPDQEWKKLERENIRLISFNDPLYPKLLKEIPNPPYTIYTKGVLNFNKSPMIAIVGSRKYTSYGSHIAQSFAKNLSDMGITIVSGMAFGIDSFAHIGALEGSGKTVAVLGNSLDEKNIYPRSNLNLSKQIALSGALLSEYPVETQAGEFTFPARNRIVAGLTLGTLVVEAGEKSGALITAQMALESNREVFSVPGPIFSSSSLGTNQLIKNGAKVVTGVNDILEELNLKNSDSEKVPTPKIPASQEEKIILSVMQKESLHIDNISKLTKLQTATVSSALAMMEIKGWVKNIGGQNYILM